MLRIVVSGCTVPIQRPDLPGEFRCHSTVPEIAALVAQGMSTLDTEPFADLFAAGAVYEQPFAGRRTEGREAIVAELTAAGPRARAFGVEKVQVEATLTETGFVLELTVSGRSSRSVVSRGRDGRRRRDHVLSRLPQLFRRFSRRARRVRGLPRRVGREPLGRSRRPLRRRRHHRNALHAPRSPAAEPGPRRAAPPVPGRGAGAAPDQSGQRRRPRDRGSRGAGRGVRPAPARCAARLSSPPT